MLIDGILNEEVWKRAVPYSDFTSFIPDYGRRVPQQTTAFLAYDTENLYFAFECLDPEPDRIKANVAERDGITADDWICINLDTRFDQQALNAFYVNPLGIQRDTRYAAGNEDASIDLVWYSAGRLTGTGYAIEVQIPLKSLRFSASDPVSMGILLERYISRTATNVGYPHLDPSMGYNYLPQLLRVDYHGVRHYSLFEAIPAVTYSHRDRNVDGALAKELRQPDLSLTLKYGITSDLVLDAAINPDFSQVEADAGQVDVNLRYQLFYPEKRPFFLEGREKFKIGATQSSYMDPIYFLVHTRTIVNPIAGAKFTGNTDSRNSIALLYGADDLPRPSDSAAREYAHFPILRYKHNLKDDGFAGFLYTGRETSESGNRVVGTDAQIRINKSTLLEYHLLGSNQTEQNSSKNSHAAGLYFHSETREFDYALTLKDIGRNFQVETGYLTRTGISQATGLIKKKFYTSSDLFRRFDLELFGSASYDRFYFRWETYNEASLLARIGGTVQFKTKYNLSNEVFLGRTFNTSGIHAAIQGRYKTWFSGNITARRIHAIYYSTDPFGGMSTRGSISATLQPWPKFETAFSLTYSDFKRPGDQDYLYRYAIGRTRFTYQFNKYLFIRAILEYNDYYQKLLTDLLVSFNYIPGTVFYLGYGSLFQQTDHDQPFLGGEREPIEMQRGFFLKLSYLFRK
ncbi:MAG: DUF5916 domain-containing protein [Bacteroidales bacterium]